nr:hypothetical protein Ade03nite_46460 [Actinoplanes derwentensis]
MFAAGLRETAARRGPGSWAAHLQSLLLEQSARFREVWERHEVGVRFDDHKRFVNPEAGLMELECQSLLDPVQSHMLLVYAAVPGSETQEKLRLLSVRCHTDRPSGRPV